jgi:hypothetical protein
MIESPVKTRLPENLGQNSGCRENCRAPTAGLSVRTGNANGEGKRHEAFRRSGGIYVRLCLFGD